MKFLSILAALCIASFLPGCSASKMAATFADMPEALGGLPKDAPPRPGTPEYEAWQNQRAIDAATPKAAKR